MKHAILTLLVFALTNTTFGETRPMFEPPTKLTFQKLYKMQLQSRFHNLQNQYTPGYRAIETPPGLILGEKRLNKNAFLLYVDNNQGPIVPTKNPEQLAIEGPGWFVLRDKDGLHFTRDGRFEMALGSYRTLERQAVQGYSLSDQGQRDGELTDIELSTDPKDRRFYQNFKEFKIDEGGKIYGLSSLVDSMTGQKITTTTPLFQVALANFESPARLDRSGTTSFQESQFSGQPEFGIAGKRNRNIIHPSALEHANVDYKHEAQTIQRLKNLESARRESQILVQGPLPTLLVKFLEKEGVVVESTATLHRLEALSNQALLGALSSYMAKADKKDRELVKDLMRALEPRIVFTR